MSIIHSNLLKDANGRQNETIERQLVRQFETNEAQQFDLSRSAQQQSSREQSAQLKEAIISYAAE
jgi:hypothetical protein